jgi:hypothetical protein
LAFNISLFQIFLLAIYELGMLPVLLRLSKFSSGNPTNKSLTKSMQSIAHGDAWQAMLRLGN